MKIFATSDTHFNHKKLVSYGRPEDFEDRILKQLAMVSGDLLIHCGDFCIGENQRSHDSFMVAAQGFKKKVLVRGNHDPQTDAWYLAHGWDMVCESFSNTYFGKRVLFTHVPVMPNKESFDFNVHGHMHGNAHRLTGELGAVYDAKWHKDLAPEIHHYAPVNLQKILV